MVASGQYSKNDFLENSSIQSYFSPSLRLAFRIILVLLCAAAFACLIYASWIGINYYDEGVVAYGAQSVVEGRLPYRDFWTLYGPGQFYLVALFFSIFGDSFDVFRAVGVVVFIFLMFYTGGIVVRLTQRSGLPAVFMLLVFFGVAAGFKILGTSVTTFLALVVASIFYCLDDVMEHGRFVRVALLLGISAWFRPDAAAINFVVIALSLLFSCYCVPGIGLDKRKLVKFLFLLLAVSIFPYVLLLIAVSPSSMYSMLIDFPLFGFSESRKLDYPVLAIRNAGFYVPWLVFLCMPLLILHRRKERNFFSMVLALCALGLILMLRIVVRADFVHLASVTPVLAILFSLLIYMLDDRLVSWQKKVAVGGLLALLLFALWLPLKTLANLLYHIPGTEITFIATPNGAKIPFIKRDMPLEQLIDFVNKHVPEHESLFVGDQGHDKVFVNEVLLYFLLDRPDATRYPELHPGITDRTDVQQEIIGDIQKNNVQWVILATHPSTEPNLSQYGAGSKLLDHYLAENFEAVQTFGRYVVLQNRAGSGKKAEVTIHPG
jgi:hypothetical protein